MRSYSGGVRHDYKDADEAPGPRPLRSLSLHHRGLRWFAIGVTLPLIAVTLMLISEPNESMVTSDPVYELSPRMDLVLIPPPGERIRLQLPPLENSDGMAGLLLHPEQRERDALLAQGELVNLTVRSGDSLDRMFRRNDLSISDLTEMVALPEGGRHLAIINPGDKIEIIRNGDRVLALSRELSDTQRLWIRRDGESFSAQLIDLETEIRTAGAHGTISTSLWDAAIEAGLAGNVIGEISNIFQWDIDFMLEVRTGDSFTVVYEEIWRDGVKLGNGEIIAAEFINRGRTYRAARYIDANGGDDHYTPEGMSVRRPFLRNPIEFSRVSSNFNPNRRHPILNTIRAHRGVDLAAPTGTEVRAAGDGKIIALGANGSFGNRVEIQHGGGISTLYAHLNGFGRFRIGDRVRQEDIIGYVGMTGSATGPHLHYEYRLNGVHQNPRTVELPDAQPIERDYLDDFHRSTASLWRQLDLYQGALLASNED